MLDDLDKRLDAKRLRMVFAAENGSRAWGFHSRDSDYDIRFIFAKPVSAYLSLHDGLQDIQYKATGDLDYAGWDIRKALLLAEKSNPSLIEWLGSPIVYADPIGFRDELRAIMVEHFSPRALAHHYINFMRNTAPVIGSAVSGGTKIADSSAVATNGAGWKLAASVTKYGAAGSNTQIGIHSGAQNGSAGAVLLTPTALTLSENLGTNVVVTGNATTTATDIALNLLTVEAANLAFVSPQRNSTLVIGHGRE